MQLSINWILRLVLIVMIECPGKSRSFVNFFELAFFSVTVDDTLGIGPAYTTTQHKHAAEI